MREVMLMATATYASPGMIAHRGNTIRLEPGKVVLGAGGVVQSSLDTVGMTKSVQN